MLSRLFISLAALCVAVGAFAQAKVPLTPADLVGSYSLHGGAESFEYDLRPDGFFIVRVGGVKFFRGEWNFEQGVVKTVIYLRHKERYVVSEKQFVPVAWGDCLLLTDSTDLLAGLVGQALARFAQEDMRRKNRPRLIPGFLVREVTSVPGRHPLYGSPIASEPFTGVLGVRE